MVGPRQGAGPARGARPAASRSRRSRPSSGRSCSSSCRSRSCSGSRSRRPSALLRDHASRSRLGVRRPARLEHRRRHPRQPAGAVRAHAVDRLADDHRPARADQRRRRHRAGARRRGRAPSSTSVAGVVAWSWSSGSPAIPGAVQQPNEAVIASKDGRLFESTEDEIASVQAGQVRSTPELWVAGTSMTLLTVDAKLMPVLPIIARPAAKRALVVAFGMGTAFRGVAHRRPQGRRRRARPIRSQDVRLVLRRRRRRPRRPERQGHHHRRSEPPRADRRALRRDPDRPAAADRDRPARRSSRRSSTTRRGSTTSPPTGS